MILAHRIRLVPTLEQEIYFRRACGVARFAYNWALAEWKRQYDAGTKPSEVALRKALNAIKDDQFPPTDNFTILDTKCREFVANGIPVVVLLISQTKSVATYRPNAEPVYAEDISAIVVGPEMPEFVLDARLVFAASIRKRPNAYGPPR
jgi:hypothetical protein